MTPNSPVVYTTCETVLDKFTGCEVVFTAGKNAALLRRSYIGTRLAVGVDMVTVAVYGKL